MLSTLTWIRLIKHRKRDVIIMFTIFPIDHLGCVLSEIFLEVSYALYDRATLSLKFLS